MQRPIGVTILAILAGLAGAFQIWRAVVFMGWVNFDFVGRKVSFENPQWGQVVWALIIAAIWFWVASGFWNVRAYAWSFGIFISLFTVIFGFFALIGNASTTNNSSVEAETIGWLLAGAVFFYLNYPGVRNVFAAHELSLLTPEQRAAMANVEAANAAAAKAMATPAAAAAAAPPAPPTDAGTPKKG